MKDQTIQPTRISKEEYTRFKQFVQDTHGTTRGHLKTEIENALREYRQPESNRDALARIEDDVATIKAAVATTEADGGSVVHTPSERQTTRARKPASNQPRSEKVAYLITELLENVAASTADRDGGQLSYKELQRAIESEYNFSDDILAEYQEMIIDELGAEPHPKHGQTIAWGTELRRIYDEIREERETEVEEKL